MPVAKIKNHICFGFFTIPCSINCWVIAIGFTQSTELAKIVVRIKLDIIITSLNKKPRRDLTPRFLSRRVHKYSCAFSLGPD